LDYQAPTLVHQALQRLESNKEGWLVLDAGCGTGLYGELVRPLARRLVGIDLSAKMLVKAQARAVYDELHEAELTAFFEQTDSVFDVITCVDTFCYFGDLSAALKASVSALKAKGWFIFTVEKLEQDTANEGFQLLLQGRYAHTESYIRKTLADAGYRVHNIDTAVLRNEYADAVIGLVVTAQLAVD
jgi:predicted TPR repeat methyltransferase